MPEMHLVLNLLCLECGYNLRGLLPSGRCPECGFSIRETLNAQDRLQNPLVSPLREQMAEFAESIGTTPDAILFVQDVVAKIGADSKSSSEPTQLNAGEICAVFRQYVIGYFNDEAEARELLGEWKLTCSEDVGKVVGFLINEGFLRSSGESQPEDFQGRFTLDTLFVEPPSARPTVMNSPCDSQRARGTLHVDRRPIMASSLQTLGIDRLSVEERITLVQEIWDSIATEAGQAPLTEAQQQELDRRIADDDANPDDV